MRLRRIVASGKYAINVNWIAYWEADGNHIQRYCEQRCPLTILQNYYFKDEIDTEQLDDAVYWRDTYLSGREETEGELHYSPTELGNLQFGTTFTSRFIQAIDAGSPADALHVIDERLSELCSDAPS